MTLAKGVKHRVTKGVKHRVTKGVKHRVTKGVKHRVTKGVKHKVTKGSHKGIKVWTTLCRLSVPNTTPYLSAHAYVQSGRNNFKSYKISPMI